MSMIKRSPKSITQEAWSALLRDYAEYLPCPGKASSHDSDLTLAGGHLLQALGQKNGKILLFDSPFKLGEYHDKLVKLRSAVQWSTRRFNHLCDRIQSILHQESLGQSVESPDRSGGADGAALLSKFRHMFDIGMAIGRQYGDTDQWGRWQATLPDSLIPKFHPEALLLRLLERRTALSGDLALPEFAMEGLLRLVLMSPHISLCEQDLLVSRPPEQWLLDTAGRLHCAEGPAVRFADGFELGMVGGVDVPMHCFTDPSAISFTDIQHEENQEVRRVLLERKGIDAFLREAGLTACAEDDYGTLYKTPRDPDSIAVLHGWFEPDCYVRLLNSTPEPGTTDEFKEYLLRVPPEMETPQQAVAWSFNLDSSEYDPAQQT